ncbi:hypothetical protein SLA2020_444110 [Shorea laevis]
MCRSDPVLMERFRFGRNAMQEARMKLSSCQEALTRWSSAKYCNVEKAIREKSKTLAALQQNEGPGTLDRIQRLQGEIDHLLEMEDIKWKQRAKQNWYRQGDRNTKFFHSWANHRLKINQIKSIIDEAGTS